MERRKGEKNGEKEYNITESGRKMEERRRKERRMTYKGK